jgi:glycosyltransferase involved in cell wall biosynthesis
MARRLLFLISELEHTGPVHQLALLARLLPHDRFDVRVFTLGGETSVARLLQRHGVAVESLGWRRALDLGALRRLRNIVRDEPPEIVHVWGLRPLRWLHLVGGKRATIVASALVTRGRRRSRFNIADRWLLRGVHRVVARTESEKARYLKMGLSADRVSVILPGVELPALRDNANDVLQRLGLPASARMIACAGRLEAHKGYRDAIWTLDILRFVYPDLQLVLLGTGPYEGALRWFANITGSFRAVHFLGNRDDVTEIFQAADVVWIPDHLDGGVMTALEAMAAGRPLIATRLGCAEEIVRDGESGVLVPTGDKPALARQTRILLDERTRAQQMGQAGRVRVAAHFSATAMIERFAGLYESCR